MVARVTQLWEVVGGIDKGGIIVRSGHRASSSAFTDRLSFGAVVAELQEVEGRLHYELVSGTGPASGWVAMSVSGKDLLVKSMQKVPEDVETVDVGDICEVTGGAEKGGIVARRGKEDWSQIRGTLSFGARISIKAREDSRLMYALIDGSGPELAWIDSEMDGKALVAIITKAVKVDLDDVIDTADVHKGVTTKTEDASLSISDLDTNVGTSDSSESGDAQKVDEDSQSVTTSSTEAAINDEVAKDLLSMYAMRFEDVDNGPSQHGRTQFRWTDTQKPSLSLYGRAELYSSEYDTRNMNLAIDHSNARQFTTQDLVYQNGDIVRLCGRCWLPLGNSAYAGKEKDVFLHSECMAEIMLERLKYDEDVRSKVEKHNKGIRRMQYDIGWRMERFPRNASTLAKLNLSEIPQGMCCLVHDEGTNSVRLAATLEPAAAINMEFLSSALRAQIVDGCEPWFSLNAVDPSNKHSWMQKQFRPEWLRNTSMGEVLFQADYHLKELSMGECDQPVVGMKSSFDFSTKQGHDDKWVGREWFVLKKAEVQLSDDNVIVPNFQLGVQAREMYLNGNGKFEDRPITRQSHPLVLYAEQFTHNFNLIAERKSVMFQLREVAKATIAAKYMVDSKMNLGNEWSDLAKEVDWEVVDEIPRLWNMRGESQIEIKDGKIIPEASINSVYGGVQLAVGRFIGTRGLAPTRAPAPILPFKRSSADLVQSTLGKALHQIKLGEISVTDEAAPEVGTVEEIEGTDKKTVLYYTYITRSAAAPVQRKKKGEAADAAKGPKGVDLNLDKFNLLATDRTPGQLIDCAASVDAKEAKASIGRVFLESLSDDADSTFQDWQKELFKGIYNPCLCDRHLEGELFVPLDTRPNYLCPIKHLLYAEQRVREERKGHFSRQFFKMSDPGSLFPTSWTSSFAIANGEAVVQAAGGDLQVDVLQVRPDFLQDEALLERMQTRSSPIFDKGTEDGTRYRIYRTGSIEVRTIQEVGKSEAMVVVFAIRPKMRPSGNVNLSNTIADNEKLAKTTMYVEGNPHVTSPLSMPDHQYYTVCETILGNTIVIEQLDDGTKNWQVNPKDLHIRNSLAKVFSTEACSSFDTAIKDVKAYYLAGLHERCTSCKQYAQGAYNKAIAQDGYDDSSLKQPLKKMDCQ